MLVDVTTRIELGQAPAGMDSAAATIGQGEPPISLRVSRKCRGWLDIGRRNEKMHSDLQLSCAGAPHRCCFIQGGASQSLRIA
jgi:hypothetical protein